MRKSKVLLFVPLMLLLIAGIAHAAFDNSHHDMATYMTTKTSACAICHGRLDQNTTAASSNFGNVGALCLIRCHSGTGLIGQPQADVVPTPGYSVNPTNYTAATPAGNYSVVYFGGAYGHGSLKAENFSNKGAASLANAQTWPYVAGTTPTNIECTSCHAVHDNQHAPFLWSALAPSSAGQFDGFCDKCHTEAVRSGVTPTTARASQGPHPINFAVDNSATGAAGRTGNSRHPRSIIIQGYGTAQAIRVFDVTTVDNNALKGLNSATGHWTIGGKLTSGQNAATATWTGGASTQILGCYTCHTVHASNANGENRLTAIATTDSGEVGWNPLCTGCHGPSTTRAGDVVETVVGTSAYGHPVGTGTAAASGVYTSSVGNFKFAIQTASTLTTAYVAGNPQAGNALGGSGQVMCTSCHKVHGGPTGYMAIFPLGQTGTNAICKQCHVGIGIPNLSDYTKGGTTSTGANAAMSHHVTSNRIPTTLPSTNFVKTGESTGYIAVNSPSWANATTGLGNILSGVMDCADCHTFNGTAHNW